MEGQRPRVVPIGSAKQRPPKPKAEQPEQKPVGPEPVPNWAWIAISLFVGFLLGLILAPHISR